jgi:hypothetical protein
VKKEPGFFILEIKKKKVPEKKRIKKKEKYNYYLVKFLMTQFFFIFVCIR